MATVLMLSAAWSVSAADVSGTASESSGTVTISGTVTDPVANQQVTVLVVEDNTGIANISAENIVYIAQTTAENNGDYSVSFIMPAGKRTGTYDIYIGGTEVDPPAKTSYTYPTEVPTTAPVVVMGDAKPAVNGANAFYYFITITLNDGVATGFNVKHRPSDRPEEDADTQNFALENIQGATVKVISVLKEIPPLQADREVTSKATLTYTLGGNAGTPVEVTERTSLNQTTKVSE